LACANKLRGVVPEAAGAAMAAAQNSNASAAAMGVIGNMNSYSDCKQTRSPTDRNFRQPDFVTSRR